MYIYVRLLFLFRYLTSNGLLEIRLKKDGCIQESPSSRRSGLELIWNSFSYNNIHILLLLYTSLVMFIQNVCVPNWRQCGQAFDVVVSSLYFYIFIYHINIIYSYI